MVGVAVALLVAAGVRRVAAKGRRWRTPRVLAMLGGAVAMAASGLLDTGRFSAHMLEHVLVGMVAPMLIATGAPATLALQAASPRTRTRLLRILHSRWLRTLTHPLVAWAVFAATPVAIYFTPLLDLTVRSAFVDVLVHLHLSVAGFVFFWPAVGTDPAPRPLPHGARVLYLLLAIPFHAFLGVALLSADEVLGGADATWTLADQRNGAAILWASGDLVGLVAGGIALWRWMDADERAAVRSAQE